MKSYLRRLTFLIAITTFLVVETIEARVVNIVVGMSMPPYFIETTNEGFELDIIQGALSKVGHSAAFKYVPLNRVPWVFEHGKDNSVDAISSTDERVNVKAYFSDIYITYQNVAITLAKNKIELKTPGELANFSVVAFQNSGLYLGEEYRKATKSNKNYMETFDQDKQVRMLFYGTSQVVIADKNIFNYYAARSANLNTKEPLVYHDIFPENDYKLAFKAESLRDEFNLGLAELKKSGEYEKIVKKWSKSKVSISR